MHFYKKLIRKIKLNILNYKLNYNSVKLKENFWANILKLNILINFFQKHC